MKLFLLVVAVAVIVFVSCNKKDESGYLSTSGASYDCGLIHYWVDSALGKHWFAFCPGPTIVNDEVYNIDSVSYRNDTLLPKMRNLYKQTHMVGTDITVVLFTYIDPMHRNMTFVFKDAELGWNNH